MTFKGIDLLNHNEFCELMANTPTPLKIIKVSDPKKSKDKDQDGKDKYYIKILFEMLNKNKQSDMSFNIKLENGLISIYSDSKLYPIISFISGLETNKITCYHDDLKDTLTNYKFNCVSRSYFIARKKYYKIIPIEKIIKTSTQATPKTIKEGV